MTEKATQRRSTYYSSPMVVHLFRGLLLVALVAATSPLRAQDDPASQTSDPASPAADSDDYDPHGVAAVRTAGLDDTAARSRFRIGMALYEEGRFLEAAREFEQAYTLSERSSLLFNAYLAYRDAGELGPSIRVLELYLDSNPEIDDADRLRSRLDAMKRTFTQLEAEDNARREAEEEERARLAAEAEAARLREEESRRRANELAEQSRLSPIGLTIAIVGGAMIAGGAVTGVLANGQFSDIEENCPNQRCVVGFMVDDEVAKADRLNLTTDILLIGGGVVAATGLIWMLVGGGTVGDQVPPATASCGPTGCRADLRLEF